MLAQLKWWHPAHMLIFWWWLLVQPSQLLVYLENKAPKRSFWRSFVPIFVCSVLSFMLFTAVIASLASLPMLQRLFMLLQGCVVMGILLLLGSIASNIATAEQKHDLQVTWLAISGLAGMMVATAVAFVGYETVINWGILGVGTLMLVGMGLLFGPALRAWVTFVAAVLLTVQPLMLLTLFSNQPFENPLAHYLTILLLLIIGWRLLLYLGQWVWLRWAKRPGATPLADLQAHPAYWDELLIFPLPNLPELAYQALRADATQAHPTLLMIGRNPWQRWAVQQALSRWINEQRDPLAALYQFIQSPAMKTPGSSATAQQTIWLAELGQRPSTKKGKHLINWLNEDATQLLTRSWRWRQAAAWQRYAAFLHQLLERANWYETAPTAEVQAALEAYTAVYDELASLPHGQEVKASIELLRAGLDGVEAMAATAVGPASPWLRPQLMQPLQGMQAFAQQRPSAPQLASQLQQYQAAMQTAAIVPPETVLLRRVLADWQKALA